MSTIESNLLWLRIFWLIQNLWRIGRSVNNEKWFKLNFLPSRIFPHLLSIFLVWKIDFSVYLKLKNRWRVGHTWQWKCRLVRTLIGWAGRRPPIAMHMGKKAPFRSHRSARSAVRTPPFPPVRSAGPPRFSSPAVVPQLSFLEACAKLSVRAAKPRSLAVHPKSHRRSPTSAAGECYRRRGCVPPSRHRCARFTAVGSSRCCCAATVPTTASAPGR
jgi:hypothetical protein